MAGGGGVALQPAVAGLVLEAVLAGEPGRGCVGERTVRGEGEVAVGDGGDERRSERIAVGVGVVGEDSGCGHGEGRARSGGVGVSHCAGSAVDLDRDHGQVALEGAIAGAVGERHGAHECGAGGIGERPVCGERDRSGRREVHEHRSEGLGGRVGVVGEHSGRGGAGEHDVLGGDVGIVDGGGNRSVGVAGRGSTVRRRSPAGCPNTGGSAVGSDSAVGPVSAAVSVCFGG